MRRSVWFSGKLNTSWVSQGWFPFVAPVIVDVTLNISKRLETQLLAESVAFSSISLQHIKTLNFFTKTNAFCTLTLNNNKRFISTRLTNVFCILTLNNNKRLVSTGFTDASSELKLTYTLALALLFSSANDASIRLGLGLHQDTNASAHGYSTISLEQALAVAALANSSSLVSLDLTHTLAVIPLVGGTQNASVSLVTGLFLQTQAIKLSYTGITLARSSSQSIYATKDIVASISLDSTSSLLLISLADSYSNVDLLKELNIILSSFEASKEFPPYDRIVCIPLDDRTFLVLQDNRELSPHNDDRVTIISEDNRTDIIQEDDRTSTVGGNQC